MRIYAHRNLHRDCWSILQRGLVVDHTKELVIDGAEFRVRPGGHARALREGRRNVHAFVVGERNHPSTKPFDAPDARIAYDRQAGAFVIIGGAQKGRTVKRAWCVLMAASGAVYAWGVECEALA